MEYPDPFADIAALQIIDHQVQKQCAVLAPAEGNINIVEFPKEEVQSLPKRFIYIDVQILLFHIALRFFAKNPQFSLRLRAIIHILPVLEKNVKKRGYSGKQPGGRRILLPDFGWNQGKNMI